MSMEKSIQYRKSSNGKENYRGVILGYDKKFDWKPGNGDIYAGVFMSALKSDSHLGAHSITENGYVFNYDNIDYKTKITV